MKKFSFAESKYLQFRAEFFNAFNQVNFGAPASAQSGSATGAGVISSVATGFNPRQIQFGLKFYH